MHGPLAERLPCRYTHINTVSHKQTGDSHTQTLGCCISLMSEHKLLRSQAETLSCGSILSSSGCLSCTCLPFLSVHSLISVFSLVCLSALSPSSLLSFLIPPSSPLPPSLCLSPPLSVGAASQRDRLKQMPSWETGYVCVCVCVFACACVHCLHKLTHWRHAHNGSFLQMGEG